MLRYISASRSIHQVWKPCSCCSLKLGKMPAASNTKSVPMDKTKTVINAARTAPILLNVFLFIVALLSPAVRRAITTKPCFVAASAGLLFAVRSLESLNIEFSHLKQCLHYLFRLLRVLVLQHLPQNSGHDLPGHAVFVF